MKRFNWFEVESVDNASTGDTHNWTPNYTPNYGLCHSYHVPEYFKSSVVKDVGFYVKEDLEIYLHHPGQFLTWQNRVYQMRAIQDVDVNAMHEVIFEICTKLL